MVHLTPLSDIKFFIGPMSKNVVNATIDYVNQSGNRIGFIPSRRQIDYCGGYVNRWSTEKFSKYLREKNSSIVICRDHGGENQGQDIDDGIKSFETDLQYLDLIHIDPFRVSIDIKQSAEKTKLIIDRLWKLNPNMMYEVGTEEAIFKYSPEELDIFLDFLKYNLTEQQFNQIKYAVVQSGTRLNLCNRTNVGVFDKDKMKEFVEVVKKYGIMSKEHNGDYLTNSFHIQERFQYGLDAINIAPEFGQLETEYYLECCKKDKVLYNKLYKMCYNSGKWKKWIPDVTMVSRDEIIMTCCHYILSEPKFITSIKVHFPNADEVIKEKIKLQLKLLNEQTKSYSI